MLPVLYHAQLPLYSVVKLYKHGVHGIFVLILVIICFPLLFPKTHIHTSQGIGESCPLRQESACLGASPSQGSTSLLPAFLSTKQNKNNVMSWQGTTLRVILLTLLYRCSHNTQAVLDAHAKAKLARLRGVMSKVEREKGHSARAAREENFHVWIQIGNPSSKTAQIHFFQIH